MEDEELYKLTLDITLRQILATGNAEQNQYYTPSVFETHYNLVTNFAITEGAKVFGQNQVVKDLLQPFLRSVLLPVKHGRIEIPKEYRHFTGASIFVTPDFKQCLRVPELAPGQVPTKEQLEEAQERAKSTAWELDMKEVDEFNELTLHSYKKPTLDYAIGCIFEPGLIKVSPFDIPFVELHYLKKPKRYKYGYKVNLDDTYSYDPNMPGAVETEWESNAEEFLFKGVQSLYAIYVRDGELQNGIEILKEKGLF